MVRKLGELGLVTHERYRGVRLTEAGTRLALEMVRHHRLLELFLAESLGVPWDRVHQEAEVLEHVLSDELEALIAAKLGHPTHDPHGDPIPSADLVIAEERHRVPVARSSRARRRPSCGSPTPTPRSCATWPRARSCPARALRVVDKQPFGGPLFVEVEGATHALGGQLATSMRVRA